MQSNKSTEGLGCGSYCEICKTLAVECRDPEERVCRKLLYSKRFGDRHIWSATKTQFNPVRTSSIWFGGRRVC